MKRFKQRVQSMLLAILLVTGGVATVGIPPANAIVGAAIGVGAKIVGGIVGAGEKATMLAVIKEILAGTNNMKELSGDIKNINKAMEGDLKSLFSVTNGYYEELMKVSKTMKGLEEIINITRDIRDVYGYTAATVRIVNSGQYISLDQQVMILERNLYLIEHVQKRITRLYDVLKKDNQLKLSDYERLTLFNKLSGEVKQLKAEARDLAGAAKGYNLLGESAKRDEQFKKEFFRLSL